MEIKLVQIITIFEKEILVIEEKTINKTRISFPIGEIKLGENNLQSAIRVCYETTGVIVTQKDLVRELEEYSLSQTDIIAKVKPLVFCLHDKQKPEIMDKDKIAKIYYMKISHFKEKCEIENEKKLLEQSLNYLK